MLWNRPSQNIVTQSYKFFKLTQIMHWTHITALVFDTNCVLHTHYCSGIWHKLCTAHTSLFWYLTHAGYQKVVHIPDWNLHRSF